MFKLAQRGEGAGLYCGSEGLFLGPSPLIMRVGGAYRIRAENEINGLLTAAYGSIEANRRLRPRLPLIRDALQKGDRCRAMILAVHAQLGPVDPEAIDRLARTEGLSKYNFNPDEPRDQLGRWTAEEADARSGKPETHEAPSSPSRDEEHPALLPVQELLPFAVRPPFFLDEPPETIRPFKEPIPRLSGKEGSKRTPSWARGQRPYVGENGRDFAKRLMDEQYGRGNWEQNRRSEYNKLKKFGDRNFRDPKSILLPDKDNYI